MNSISYIDPSHNNPSISTCNEVAEITKPLAKLGINFFTYTRVEKDGGRLYLSATPGVLERYFKGKWYLTGNTEGCPLHYKSQVVLWDSLPNQTILDENARAYNHDHGMYLIESGSDYCDFYGFATHKGNHSIVNTYLTKLDYLKSFTLNFQEQAKKIISRVAEKKIVLPFSHYTIDLTVYDNSTDESITISHPNHQVKFTPKQLAVAYKFLDGKGVKTIAHELKLSPRTIEQYINTLKMKLDCSKSTELILKLSKLIAK